MLRKMSLAGGILSSLLYAAMTVFVATQWKGYSSASQVISELSAIGAPTRSLWLLSGAVHTVLVTAFGWSVFKSAGRSRALRAVGGLIAAYGALGLLWPFAPMHLREALAGDGSTFSDTMHIVLASVTVLLMLFAIGFGAAALGGRFRLYSIATILILVVFGALTFVDSPRVASNLPTPWIGVWERINVGVFLLWVVVLATVLLRARDAAAPTTRTHVLARHRVRGQVTRGFEAVRDAFADNFADRHELGGACCAYQRGEKVVDLWGGIRNRQSGEPWEQNTMVIVHSATKGLAAMTLAIAHSRGWLDYDERVCTYWPEFAQQGKERVTVRQLLAHQAGLFAINEPVDRSIVADLDRLAIVLARQKPAWEPGTRQAYHALTLGFYEGELLRRVDPRHRSLGQFFQDEIASPLGLDLYIRLPETIPNSRLATLALPGRMEMLLGFPLRLSLEAMNPRSNIHRALVINPGTAVYFDQERVYARGLEVPSGNAVGTARAIARAYSVFATGGRELGLRKETLDLLAAPAAPPTRGFYDECLKGEVQFSLGFMKPSAAWPFGGASSFGAPGSGGSLGFADPTTGVGYAYVTSQMGTALTGDPRDVALRKALYSAIPASSGRSPVAA
jgi:CubicO group peptidase (beta-lactamase class C family)